MSNENKATVQRIYDALALGDTSVFAASVGDDYVWQIAGQSSWSKRFEGAAAVRDGLLGPLFSRFASRYTAEVISIVGEGDVVVAEVRGRALTHEGRRYDNEYCFVFRFSDGKIASITEYGDTDLEERVLGRYDDVLAAFAARR